MIKYIDHIGIAVKDIIKSNELFEQLLGDGPYKMEYVESEAVETSFFRRGETKIELVASTTEDGVINKFIDKRGEGLHHVAFEVVDIRAEMKRLKAQGFILLSEEPKIGADRKWVCFVHPKTANGVLVEICQSMDQHFKEESE